MRNLLDRAIALQAQRILRQDDPADSDIVLLLVEDLPEAESTAHADDNLGQYL